MTPLGFKGLGPLCGSRALLECPIDARLQPRDAPDPRDALGAFLTATCARHRPRGQVRWIKACEETMLPLTICPWWLGTGQAGLTRGGAASGRSGRTQMDAR